MTERGQCLTFSSFTHPLYLEKFMRLFFVFSLKSAKVNVECYGQCFVFYEPQHEVSKQHQGRPFALRS